MSSSNSPPSADRDDPWEELADLVGLQMGKEYTASPTPVVERVEPRETVPDQAPVSMPEPEEVREVPSDVTFTPESEAETRSDVVSAEAVPPAAPAVSAASPSPQDSYWDALANWNWDESEGGAGKAIREPQRAPEQPPARGGAPRGREERRERRGGERPDRGSARGSSRPGAPAQGREQRPAEPAATDDFGLGVDEGEALNSPAEESVFEDETASETNFAAEEPAAPAAHREGARSEAPRSRGSERPRRAEGDEDFPRKRRRRRRRRGRGGEQEATESAPAAQAAVPGADWDDSAGPESDFEAEPESVSEPTPAESVEPGAGERPERPHGRRRDRRREGSSRRRSYERDERFDEETQEPQEISVGGGATEPGLDDGDDSGEPVVSYENVPTWEEAISYLLHPSQVQVEPGSAAPASEPRPPAPADQPRQTRHLGNRKHRR